MSDTHRKPRLEAGDLLGFEDGRYYTVQKSGWYSVKGKVTCYNGIELKIDYLGPAQDEDEAFAKALDSIRERMCT